MLLLIWITKLKYNVWNKLLIMINENAHIQQDTNGANAVACGMHVSHRIKKKNRPQCMNSACSNNAHTKITNKIQLILSTTPLYR